MGQREALLHSKLDTLILMDFILNEEKRRIIPLPLKCISGTHHLFLFIQKWGLYDSLPLKKGKAIQYILLFTSSNMKMT